MKLNSIYFNNNALAVILLIVRIFIGFAMLTHGYPKLQQLLSGADIQFFNIFGLGQKLSLILAVFAEVVCSLFLILGLFTRTFVVPLIITMAVAGFIVHSADSFATRELAFVYLSIYLIVFVLGGGNYSIDALMNQKKNLKY